MKLRIGTIGAWALGAACMAAETPMITVPLGPRTQTNRELPVSELFHFEPPPMTYEPATAMERALDGKLIRVEDGVARPLATVKLSGVKFYALYFCADWNRSSRAFSEKLAGVYPRLRTLFPEFEVLMVSRDPSASAMIAGMRYGKMLWPALRWDLNAGASGITHYGHGIPCLVLVDAGGNVLSDTVRADAYVGPERVLDDIWRILLEHRQSQLGPKTAKSGRR